MLGTELGPLSKVVDNVAAVHCEYDYSLVEIGKRGRSEAGARIWRNKIMKKLKKLSEFRIQVSKIVNDSIHLNIKLDKAKESINALRDVNQSLKKQIHELEEENNSLKDIKMKYEKLNGLMKS